VSATTRLVASGDLARGEVGVTGAGAALAHVADADPPTLNA
jgi:hypothetical protein